jgi:hypothetical protein
MLAVALLAAPAGAWYPRATQVELATATWCTWCPDAYEGIELNRAWFDRNEFNSLRYYVNTGGLSCPTSMTRINYYGVTGWPTAFFDGPIPVVGGGEEVASGLAYRSVIESELASPSYFKLTLNSFSFAYPTGSIDMDIEVMEDIPNITNTFLRIILAEDNLSYGGETYFDVCRGSVPDIAITVDQFGQIQHVYQTFAIDPTWIPGNMELLAFIQHDPDKAVYASITSLPKPTYSLRYYALGNRIAVGDPTPPLPHVFEPFRVLNAGTQPDHYTISVAAQAPGDWTCVLCDPEGICYGPVYEVDLDPEEYVDLVVDFWPHSSGYGTATVTLTQDNIAPDHARTIRYQYITNDLEVLVVDDDGSRTYEDYYTDVLDHFGYRYGVWDRNLQAPTFDELLYFPAIVWSLGLAYPTLDANDRAALGSYLDIGGRVFVTGQDLGWELNDIGGAAYAWYQQYLHARFILDNTNIRTLTGVAGDPISDGIDLVIQGGDGADNQAYPDGIDANDAFATIIFNYNASRKGALRVDNGNYKVVYFGFGFEGIDNAADRRVVLRRILRWFNGAQDAPDGSPAYAGSLRAFPGVVSSSATVRFTLPTAGAASLQVFNTEGRLVRTLVDGRLAAGPHALTWDGTDARGARVPAGVYCYRLQAEGADLQQKAVVVD